MVGLALPLAAGGDEFVAMEGHCVTSHVQRDQLHAAGGDPIVLAQDQAVWGSPTNGFDI
jgi:hypothetical protein